MAIGMITGIKSNDNDLKLTLSQNFIELEFGIAPAFKV